MSTANTSSQRVVLTPRGEFSLAASIGFLVGFTPLSYDGRGDDAQTLRLAFPAEGSWEAVGITARQDDGGRVTATVEGADDLEQVRQQLERMLSLDVDGSPPGWSASCGACGPSASPRPTRLPRGRCSVSASR